MDVNPSDIAGIGEQFVEIANSYDQLDEGGKAFFKDVMLEIGKSAFPIVFKDLFVGLSESFRTFEGESDRGCLLVGLSLIDDRLGALLHEVLNKHGAEKDAEWMLDPAAGNRPLASLAVRTRMARCLGLIDDDVRDVIDELRKARNKHAHGRQSCMVTPELMAPIIEKWSPKRRAALQESLKVGEEGLGRWQEYSDARQQLIACITQVTIAIEFEGALKLLPWDEVKWEMLKHKLSEMKSQTAAAEKETPAG